MKKLIVFILLLMPLCFLALKKPICGDIANFDVVTKACVVTKEDVGENAVSTLQYNYLLVDGKEDLLKVATDLNAEGLILYLKKDDYEKFTKTLNMLTLKQKIIDNKTIVYAFTPQYSKTVFMENKKVNMEIVFEKDDVIIGFPTILSGF